MMRTRPGPFYIFEISERIARLPGRAEVDREEAIRISDDIAEWYLRGEFHDDEVVAYTVDAPGLRSLAEIKADFRRRGENWRLWQPEWRAGYALTAPAARCYLEGCGFAGAPRVRREWFGDPPKDKATRPKPTSDELDEWMRKNVQRGAKRDLTLKACRDATGATYREAAAAFGRLPQDLKLKRGQRTGLAKSEQ
jgi:hypothetical protein